MLVSITDAARLLRQVRARAKRVASSMARISKRTEKMLSAKVVESIRSDLQQAYGLMREMTDVLESIIEP